MDVMVQDSVIPDVRAIQHRYNQLFGKILSETTIFALPLRRVVGRTPTQCMELAFLYLDHLLTSASFLPPPTPFISIGRVQCPQMGNFRSTMFR